MDSRLGKAIRFIRIHWFSFLMGTIGVVLAVLYVVGRIKFGDALLQVGMDYMADLALICLFVLMVILVIYYVERQHRIRGKLKETSNALRESGERLRNIFENTSDVIFATGTDGTTRFVSPNVSRLTGFTPEQIMGKPFSDFIDEDSRPLYAYYLKKALEGERHSESFEAGILTSGGSTASVSVRLTPTYSDEDSSGVMGMMADISESRRMEEEILRYTRALSALTEIGTTLSHSFEVRSALEESLACTLDIMGLDSGAIYEFDEQELEFRLLVEQGLPEEFAERVGRIQVENFSQAALPDAKKGSILPGYAYMPPDVRVAIEREGFSFVCATALVVRDSLAGIMMVSDHRSRELDEADVELLSSIAPKIAVALENSRLLKELVKSRTELEATLESIDDPVAVVDFSGEISYVNRRLEQLLETPRAELMGMRLLDVFRERLDRSAAGPGAGASMLEKDHTLPPEPFEMVLDMKGKPRTYQVVTNGIELSDSRIGFVLVMHDITDFKRLDQMKSDFVAAASHQLRTPLASIVGFTETILHHYDRLGDSDKKGYTEIVARQGRKLAAIVNDLLDFSRIEEGRITLDRDNVVIPELVDKLILDFKLECPEHEFHTEFQQEFPPVYADYFKVEHILNNLIANSVKYSPEGGVVRIGGRRVDHGVEIWVSDQGIGMTGDEIENLFARFYRAPQTRVMSSAGTGLGLYIVKMLLEAHGGDIRVESEPGSGSTFTLFLPRG